jgi:hypothetical protein
MKRFWKRSKRTGAIHWFGFTLFMAIGATMLIVDPVILVTPPPNGRSVSPLFTRQVKVESEYMGFFLLLVGGISTAIGITLYRES